MAKQQAVAIAPVQCYGFGMARKNELKALRKLVGEAHDILRTTTLPEARSQRAEELLRSAIFLADHLIAASPAGDFQFIRICESPKGPSFVEYSRWNPEKWKPPKILTRGRAVREVSFRQ